MFYWSRNWRYPLNNLNIELNEDKEGSSRFDQLRAGMVVRNSLLSCLRQELLAISNVHVLTPKSRATSIAVSGLSRNAGYALNSYGFFEAERLNSFLSAA